MLRLRRPYGRGRGLWVERSEYATSRSGVAMRRPKILQIIPKESKPRCIDRHWIKFADCRSCGESSIRTARQLHTNVAGYGYRFTTEVPKSRPLRCRKSGCLPDGAGGGAIARAANGAARKRSPMGGIAALRVARSTICAVEMVAAPLGAARRGPEYVSRPGRRCRGEKLGPRWNRLCQVTDPKASCR